MTAKDLIASGYRLHWVTVTKEIPVLCKPEEKTRLTKAESWAADDAGTPTVRAVEMVDAASDDRGCLPFTTAPLTGDPPTIGELLDAMRDSTP